MRALVTDVLAALVQSPLVLTVIGGASLARFLKVGRAIALIAAILACRPLGAEQIRCGDILVNQFGGKIFHYRPDGTLVQSFTPSSVGTSSEGATVTVDGKVVTTLRGRSGGPSGVSIFDSGGNETLIATPEVNTPADVSVFADGTLAVNDQGASKVELYAPDGAHLSTITHASIFGASTPFGSVIGPDDTLWLASFNAGVSRFTRDGAFLSHFKTGFAVPDIGVDPVDGTLWIPSSDGRLHHFSPDGVELTSFATEAATPFVRGVAVAPDQTIYVTSFVRSGPTSLFHYNANGQLLDKIAVESGPLFISVQTVPEASSAALAIVGLAGLLTHRGKH